MFFPHRRTATEAALDSRPPPADEATDEATAKPTVKAAGEAAAGPQRPLIQRAGPYLLAFILPLVVIAAATVLGGHSNPFNGPAGLTDDGHNQLLPMHAHLWDLIRGHGSGDIFWNWNSGYGVPFLPDYAAYLASPYAPLVALFPRTDIALAMFIVSALKYATAGVGMTWYLLSVYGGRRFIAPFLGLAYAVCGWAVNDAAYVTMWLDGLAMLPFVLLAAEWCLDRKRWVWAVLIVGITWWANFYTGYMATLLASFVFVARALIRADLTWKARLHGALRWATAVITGLCLSAPALLPLFYAIKQHVATPQQSFHAIGWASFAARLIPGTEGVGASPGLAVGTMVLLLAFALPFARIVPLRERAGWTLLTVAIAASTQWQPTQWMWYGGASPNGSEFREAFVVCALVVVAAWAVLARGRPGFRALLAGAGLTLAALAADGLTPYWNRVSATLVLASLAVGAAGYLAIRRGGRRLLLPVGAVLAVAVIAEQTVSAVQIGNVRNIIYRQSSSTLSGDASAWAGALAAGRAGPATRVAAGRRLTLNDPMLIGSDDGQYYSSVIPQSVSQQLRASGMSWTGGGHTLIGVPNNPVMDSIYGVSRRVTVAGHRVRVTDSAAAPILTWRTASADMGQRGSDPFQTQALLAGAAIYRLPPATVVPGGGVVTITRIPSGYRIRTSTGAATFTVSGACPPRSQIVAWLPQTYGSASQGGNTAHFPRVRLATSHGLSRANGLAWLGHAPRSGRVIIEVTTDATTSLPLHPFGCLDVARWESAIASLAGSDVSAPRFSGHGFVASAHAQATGVAVLATAYQPGWTCSLDRRPAVPMASWHGLLGVRVPAGAHVLSCGYDPPGLGEGITLSAVAIVALLAVLAVTWLGLPARRFALRWGKGARTS